ncbi:AraC-type DNA-binding protein [Spirosomataceae bacterium TFI 002]|nr:AraC-type DNA-binding protein [Spirosomataceae bacterium TFI 002]
METDDEHLKSNRIAVPEAFGTIFTHFYHAENKSTQAITRTLLPNFQMIMVFIFGTPVQLISENNSQINIDKCIVLGPVKKAFEYTLPIGSEMLVANFKDDAFYRFFGKVTLSDKLPTNPDELLEQNCFTHLWHLVKNANHSDRVNLILDFCSPYLKSSETAFKHFKEDYTVFNPIKAIAQETNQSERTIQLNHKKYFGFTAKEKVRYQRFIQAIELLQTPTQETNWFDIIDACGYYDQSQLIHDFKHFIGHTPVQYLKFQKEICITN